MDIVRMILLAVHVLGFAALLGALFAQLSAVEKRFTPVIRWGARIAFLTGVLLVGVLEMDDADVNHAKIGVKLLIALVILGLVEANGKKAKVTNALYLAVTALAVVNVIVAIFVSPAHGAY